MKVRDSPEQCHVLQPRKIDHWLVIPGGSTRPATAYAQACQKSVWEVVTDREVCRHGLTSRGLRASERVPVRRRYLGCGRRGGGDRTSQEGQRLRYWLCSIDQSERTPIVCICIR